MGKGEGCGRGRRDMMLWAFGPQYVVCIPVPGFGMIFPVLGNPDGDKHGPGSLITGVYLPGIMGLIT